MNFLNCIKNISDDKLKIIIKERIQELENDSDYYNSNANYIGFNLDYNNHLDLNNENNCIHTRYLHSSYIKKGTKIVYGYTTYSSNLSNNQGLYYYVDIDDYLYDFCKYIKENEVNDEYDFFDYMYFFIIDYFKQNELVSRDVMHRLIYKNEMSFYKPIKEHKLSDFKENRNAMCSEVSILVQNILSLFGYKSYYVFGTIDKKDVVENHAFNILEDDDKVYLLDFSIPVNNYNYDATLIQTSPYVEEISTYEYLNLLSCKSVSFNDYEYILLNEIYLRNDIDDKREYTIFNKINENYKKLEYKLF